MRKFGKDTPEFFVFQLEGNKKTFKIPLAASMTNRDILEFEDTNGDYRKQVAWLEKFMGDTVNDLTASETADILRAWADESKDQGATPGES